jgi:hypothetical protein
MQFGASITSFTPPGNSRLSCAVIVGSWPSNLELSDGSEHQGPRAPRKPWRCYMNLATFSVPASCDIRGTCHRPQAAPTHVIDSPAEIIDHCVWLYLRFCLNYRDIEELMAKRSIILTDELGPSRR